MKKRLLLLFSIAFSFYPLLVLSQWQADMTNSMQGNVQLYKVHCDGNWYRYDFTSDDINGVVIVKPSENITAIILVDKQMVHYTSTDGMMSQMNDPVQAYSGSLQYGVEKIEGNEKIDRFDCIKMVIYQGETALLTQWFSEKLNFPVKIENHYSEDTYMLLENIEKWKPDSTSFIVPESFIEVDENMKPVIPEPAPPEDWVKKEAAVPVDMIISRGMAINVAIDETVYHKLSVKNTGDTPAKFSYHSYVDGVELSDKIQGPESFRTKRLYVGEDYNMTLDWKAGQLILFKIYEGEASLKIIKE
jgi:hypothetical protein